jgi:hypothetical protein
MQKIIEKFYAILFENKESKESVPYANKAFMFYFSIVSFSVVLYFIIKDILNNILEAN